MNEMKAVFFDLGGTLRICDHIPEYETAARDKMAALVGAEDPAAFIQMVEDRYVTYREWAMGESKEAGDYELWDKWLLPEFPKDKLTEICHELTYQYRQFKGCRHVVEGGVEVIQELDRRGYKLGIISNLIGEREIFDWLKADGLERYFGTVVLSSVTRIRKPDPEMYRMAARELGVPLSACVNVADNLKRDFTGAKEAGVGANVMFMPEEKFEKKKGDINDANRPDFVVHRFIDILDLPILPDKEA